VQSPTCCWLLFFFIFSFFFLAEDGIRDFHVTGVQTCALPICLERQRGGGVGGHRAVDRHDNDVAGAHVLPSLEREDLLGGGAGRSEERRGRKGCEILHLDGSYVC